MVHAYHYARFSNVADAKNEAKWCLVNLKKLGIHEDSVIALDVEDANLPKGNLNPLIESFLATLHAAGFHKTDIYTMASWIWAKRIRPKKLRSNLWIANYGVTEPGVDNVGTWQYTNAFHDMNLDMSYDFRGFYTQDPEKHEGKF